MTLYRLVRKLTVGGGLRADVDLETDYIPTADEDDALAGPSGYTPNAADPYATAEYTKDKIDAVDWQESVTTEINYVHPDEAPDGHAYSGACNITDGGGGTLNCFNAGHGFGSGIYSVQFTSAVYGTIVRTITVVDVDNFTIVEPYTADEAAVPYVFTTPPTEGEKCLNLNSIAGTGPLLHTFTGGSWNAGVAPSTGDRFIWRTSGTDQSADSGDYPADDQIREYEGGASFTFRVFAIDKGTVYMLETDNIFYQYNGSSSYRNFHRRASKVVFIFRGDVAGLGQSQTDVPLFDVAGILDTGVVMDYDYYIVGATLQSNSARTAGTLTVEPWIDSGGGATEITASDLDLVLDGTNTSENYATVVYGATGFSGSAGDKIGANYTTDAPWATASGTESIFYILDIIEQ